jgi:hypothetical protein
MGNTTHNNDDTNRLHSEHLEQMQRKNTHVAISQLH